MGHDEPRQALTDLAILEWLKSSEVRHRADTWPGSTGVEWSLVETRLNQLERSDHVRSRRSLADTTYSLATDGETRLAELQRPETVRRLRSQFLRQTWLQRLYGSGARTASNRYSPADHREDSEFVLAAASADDHEAALSYLYDERLIDRLGAWGEPFLFVWLTPAGMRCAESERSLTDYLGQTSNTPIVQHNHVYSTNGAVAIGRDHVSATSTFLISDSDLTQLRDLVAQIDEPDVRDDASDIADDVEEAVKSGDRTALRKRLEQLRRLAGRVTVEGVKIALAAYAQAQMATLLGG